MPMSTGAPPVGAALKRYHARTNNRSSATCPTISRKPVPPITFKDWAPRWATLESTVTFGEDAALGAKSSVSDQRAGSGEPPAVPASKSSHSARSRHPAFGAGSMGGSEGEKTSASAASQPAAGQ